MNLHQLFLTENACYKTYRKHTVKGIMVHSTGANNPWLKRYIGPDDGLLGVNQYGNHWNTYHPGDREVCVHGFIGKLKDGTIATYQTLPWEICGWHSGSGSKGNANFLGYVGFEICEDDLTDATYFNKVYKEAIELCVYLCKKYGLTEKNIICHCEGHQQGIASNHGDVMHWFPKHGKSIGAWEGDMNSFSANILNGISKMIVAYGDGLNDEVFKEKIGAMSIKQLTRTAKERRPGSMGYAEAMVLEYNGKKKSDTNRLNMNRLYTRDSALFRGIDDPLPYGGDDSDEPEEFSIDDMLEENDE